MRVLSISAICILSSALPGYGAQVTLTATNSGRYFDSGAFLAGQYGTGWHSGVPGEARSFFSFDLTGVTGTIVSASLHLETNPLLSTYLSPDPTETFALFDVNTALSALTGGSGGAPAFTDLGTGTVFGSVIVDGTAGQFIDISLNSSGVAYLNGLGGGTGILGGAITTLAKGATKNEIIFNGTNASLVRQLILQTDTGSSTPEPATWAMAGVGMLLALATRRGRRPHYNDRRKSIKSCF